MMVELQTYIRTGILHVPAFDTAAGEAVSRKLGAALRRVVIQQESYAASDRRWLEDMLCKWCDEDELDLLFTIGGTLPAPGPSVLETVPESTAAVIERNVPGLAEAMRALAREEFPAASLHRGVTGVRGRTLIVNLPGGAEAAALFLEAILEDLPYVLAHLRDSEQAMTLDQVIRQAEGEAEITSESPLPRDDEKAQTHTALPDAKPSGKGLNAEEFAAFLRRSKGGEN